MYRAGVCGHFGGEKNFLNGQTIKTKILTEELKTVLGSNLVQTVDTYSWKSNPTKLLKKCYNLSKRCENIIIMPAHNGIKVLVPLFLLFNKIFNKKLYYIVIGGWLPTLLETNNRLKNQLKKFDTIFVETDLMVKSLKKLGLNNIKYLPNFKCLNILEENEIVYSFDEPYRLCTFSRVMKEKGIEDAIDVVKSINKTFGRIVYSLDIYGQIDGKYSERFEKLSNDFPCFITYKGCIDFKNTVNVLKNYFALLLPTHFKTEGLPGTIIDAYAAGLPVIASEWNSAKEIISPEITGLLYDFGQKLKLEELLIQVLNKPQLIICMKKNCIIRSYQYLPKYAMSQLIKYL